MSTKPQNYSAAILMVLVVLAAFGFGAAQKYDREKAAERARPSVVEPAASEAQVSAPAPSQASTTPPQGSFRPAAKQSAPVPPPVIEEPEEVEAKVGTYRGRVVVCKYGEVPRAQAWGAGVDGKPRAICLKLSETKVVKVPWRPSNGTKYSMSRIYMNGQGYPVDYLNLGDLIEVKVENQGYDGPMISEGRLLHRPGS